MGYGNAMAAHPPLFFIVTAYHKTSIAQAGEEADAHTIAQAGSLLTLDGMATRSICTQDRTKLLQVSAGNRPRSTRNPNHMPRAKAANPLRQWSNYHRCHWDKNPEVHNRKLPHNK